MPRASSAGGIIRTLGRAALVLTAGFGLSASLLGAEVSGFVKREIYYKPGAGEPNGNPATFTNPNYPNNPDAVTFLDSFAAPQSANPNVEDYLTKISGFIHPAVTGDYVFFFSCDDHGAFYLSTDESPANLKLLAQESNWSNPLQWRTSGGTSDLTAKRSDTFAGTTWPGGATVHLESGKKYYAVALGKEGGGGDNTGVTMLLKGDVTDDVPADGDASTLTLALISTEAPTALGFLKNPADVTTPENRTVTFSALGVGAPGNPVQDPTLVVPDFTYQWLRNGVAIDLVDVDGDGIADDGSNTPTYTLALAKVADNGVKFSCKITTGDGTGTATSTAATLTVSSDTVAPAIASAASSADFKHVTVTFSERVGASAAVAGNYTISGGVTVSAATAQNDTTVQLTTSLQPGDSVLTLTVSNVKDLAGNTIPAATTATFHTFVFKSGLITYKTWQNETGAFATFTDETAPVSAKPPTTTELRTRFEANTADVYDNYFGQLVGYFSPPSTGDYVFFMSSDDHGELYLSTDEDPANKVKIAEEPSWSSRRNWVGNQTDNNGATRGEDGVRANRSDQYAFVETDPHWPTGNTISLTKGKKYYIELLFKEGGGGDNGGATYKLASAADPADFSDSTITGAVIGNYVDPSTLPPLITQRPTTQHYKRGDTVTMSVTVDSGAPVTYQWYRSKKAIAGATSATLTIPNAGVEAVGDYMVTVTSVNGSVSSYPDDDARAIMDGAFAIELEDFNWGGGKSVAAASTMPLAPSLYYGLDGLPGIDFHLVNQSTGDPTVNGNVYRNGYNDTNSVAVDFPILPEALGNVDVLDDAGNGDRGSFSIQQNHKIGWGDTGEWYQYTRDFPPGDYNVVLGAGLDGRGVDALGARLDIVTGDITKVGAATTPVASLLSDGTGAWSSDDYITFKNLDGSGSLAKVTLGANTTVRLNMSVGGYDFDFLLFYKLPGGGEQPTISIGADGKITFTGTLTGSSDPAGPYQPVVGATSPFTPDRSASAQKFYRSSN